MSGEEWNGVRLEAYSELSHKRALDFSRCDTLALETATLASPILRILMSVSAVHTLSRQ
jgi:hypothetical protein